MSTELTRVWKGLDRDDRLEIIENGIDFCNVSEGSITLRLFRKGNSISAFVSNELDNHLTIEAVSQSTLSTLFSDDHDYEEADAEVILNWMETQA